MHGNCICWLLVCIKLHIKFDCDQTKRNEPPFQPFMHTRSNLVQTRAVCNQKFKGPPQINSCNQISSFCCKLSQIDDWRCFSACKSRLAQVPILRACMHQPLIKIHCGQHALIEQSALRLTHATYPNPVQLRVGYCQPAAKKKKNYSTLYSRVVSHRSTDNAITSLTSEIGRDPVLFGVYGRSY